MYFMLIMYIITGELCYLCYVSDIMYILYIMLFKCYLSLCILYPLL